MEKSFLLTDVLHNFLEPLKVIPERLKNPMLGMLLVLVIFNLTIMMKKFLDDENFNPMKYLIQQVWKFTYLSFIIFNYVDLIEGIRQGFYKIASFASGATGFNSNFLGNPSGIIDIAGKIWDNVYGNLIGYNPKTWLYFIPIGFIMIAFSLIAFGLILTWIEYYFLIGMSIIFVPFGIVEETSGYFKNILKTVVGCNVKLLVVQYWLYVMQPILLKYTEKTLEVGQILNMTVTALVLALVLISLPALASGLLTGSPSASMSTAAMSAINTISNVGSATANTINTMIRTAQVTGATAKGAVQGGIKGGQQGAKYGSRVGTVGTIIGGTTGTIAGATIGGAYSGGKALFGGNKNNQDSKNSDTKKETGTNTPKNNTAQVNTDMEAKTNFSKNNNKTIDTNTGTEANISGNNATQVKTDTGDTGSSSDLSENNNGKVDTNTGTERTKLNGEEL